MGSKFDIDIVIIVSTFLFQWFDTKNWQGYKLQVYNQFSYIIIYSIIFVKPRQTASFNA